MNDGDPVAVSPYATGGGGIVLEHHYGAVLLAHLLTGDPVPLVGDDAAPLWVRFQASAFSPVDDLVVTARTPEQGERRVSIGVRRAPRLAASDKASAALLAPYLRIVTGHWHEVQSGRWRLGLAVASPNVAVQQVRELSVIARGMSDEAAFRQEVQRPQRTNQGVRDRLGHMDSLVRAAAATVEPEPDVDSGELTWRLLSVLQMTELRLEGVEGTDRTAAIGRLRTATADGTVAAADGLFSRLVELADRYASEGAEVTESLLRRDLYGTPLARSRSYDQAWTILDGLAARLHDRTGFLLADSRTELELERPEARDALSTNMMAAARGAAALVVIGEPDVGKSALALRATGEMKTAGVAVTSLSLRDLPATTGEFEALLGSPLATFWVARPPGQVACS